MSDSCRPFDAARVSLVGSRPSNQDRCQVLYSGDALCLSLGDGLGGHPRGDIAAQILVDVCESLFRHAANPIADPERFLLQCIGKAHRAIIRFGGRQQPPIAPRTTAVVALVQHGMAYWAHVGDSRLYLIRDGEILIQTRDHAQVRFVRESGEVNPRPRSSLTRCLGGMIQPPVTTCGPPTLLQAGDTLVLCSDGLWGQVAQGTLLGAFAEPTEAVESQLRGLAAHAAEFSNSDNVSAIAVRWQAAPPPGAASGQMPDLPTDPGLERAIEHLNNMLDEAGHKEP